jgi:hypothetical protein
VKVREIKGETFERFIDRLQQAVNSDLIDQELGCNLLQQNMKILSKGD